MKYLVTLTYKSSFTTEADSKKDALKLFEQHKKENFFIGINPYNNSSISHNGSENMKFHSEGIDQKAIQIYQCKECPRIFKDKTRELCEYCSKS